MEEILETLIQRIQAEMPEIRYVSEDCGQLEMLEERERTDYPVQFPAVLVDCTESQWSNVWGLSQKGAVTVKIRLLADCFEEIQAGIPSPAATGQRAVLQTRLYEVLQGFRAADFAHGLIRSGAGTRVFRHGIKVYETVYQDTLDARLPEHEVRKKVERVQLALSRISGGTRPVPR